MLKVVAAVFVVVVVVSISHEIVTIESEIIVAARVVSIIWVAH